MTRLIPLMSAALACVACFAFVRHAPASGGAVDLGPVEKWLSHQMSVRTLATEFREERKLRTVRKPLRTSGRFWLDRDNDRFRWQIGEPPRTVAIRDRDSLVVLTPAQKTARRHSLSGSGGNGSKAPPALRFLAEGFPASIEELQKSFQIMAVERRGDLYEASLRPLDGRLTVALREIVFLIDAGSSRLRGFRLRFRDQSEVTTTFHQTAYNPALEAARFAVDLSGYAVKGAN